MGEQTPEERPERRLHDLTDAELEELISELPADDPMAEAIRAMIDRRRRDRA